MKKTLLFVLLGISFLGYAQLAVTVSPQYGCPNTSNNSINVTVTNNLAFGIPAGATVSISMTDPSSNVVGTYSGTSAGIAASGGTEAYTVTGANFTVAGNYTVSGTASITVPIALSYPFTSTYVVQYPPDLTLTESPTGTINTSALSGYSVRYYLDADYNTVVNESTTTSYVAPTFGNYTAKAYDPATGCLSQNASNSLFIVTSIEEKLGFEVSVYPNPVVTELTVTTQNGAALSYEISDLKGNSLQSGNFSLSTKINTESLQAGIYILKVKDASGKFNSFKLTK